jgi:hypothetical protein
VQINSLANKFTCKRHSATTGIISERDFMRLTVGGAHTFEVTGSDIVLKDVMVPKAKMHFGELK